MMDENIAMPDDCTPDLVMDHAAGELDHAAAHRVERHLESCAACRRTLAAALALDDALTRARPPAVDPDRQDAVWARVADAAESSARRTERRAAWRTVLASPAARLGALAAAAAVLVALAIWPAEAPELPEQTVSSVPNSPAPQVPRSPAPRIPGIPGPQVPSPTASQVPSPPVPTVVKRTKRARPAPARRVATLPRGARRLACGAVLLTRDGDARTTTNSRARAEVRLTSGRVDLRVPRLPRGATVQVKTPDATVLVRGTRFSVARAHGATTVSVQQGKVWVEPVGRNRARLELTAGQRRIVPGQAAYLKQLLRQMEQAIDDGQFATAVKRGRRYLEVTSRPVASVGVRLRLAGALARLGKVDRAEALYRKVSRGKGPLVARENALALLAGLQQRQRRPRAALATWSELLRRFPRGAHAREARLRLVRATCKQTSKEARRLRRQLRRCCAGDPSVASMLLACTPGGGDAPPR